MEDSIFLTIVVGVSVFVLSQFILKLVLEPMVDFKTTLGELSALFLREQAKITNAQASSETQDEIKRLSSPLLAHQKAIPFYRQCSWVLRLPPEENIISSCRSLNWIGAHVIPDAAKISPRSDIPIEIFKEMKNINDKLNVTITYINL